MATIGSDLYERKELRQFNSHAVQLYGYLADNTLLTTPLDDALIDQIQTALGSYYDRPSIVADHKRLDDWGYLV